MSPEAKFYVVVGLVILSSSVASASVVYVAFRIALRRALSDLFRLPKVEGTGGRWHGRYWFPDSDNIALYRDGSDFRISATTDESR